MGIAEDLRALCADDTLPITWGIRPQIKVARALKWFAMPSAYRLATAEYVLLALQDDEWEVVRCGKVDRVRAPATTARRVSLIRHVRHTP